MNRIAGGLIGAGEYGDQVNSPISDGTGKIRSYPQSFLNDMAPQVGKDLETPPGWGVVVIGFGDDMSERGPVPVAVGDWQLRFPRNKRCAIPESHLHNLFNTVETKYMQAHDGSPMVAYKSSRYTFQVLKYPERMEKIKDQDLADLAELEVK